VEAFQTDDRELALAMQNAVYAGDAALEYCFCSIFDRCWTSGIGVDAVDDPTPVDECPDYGEERFRD